MLMHSSILQKLKEKTVIVVVIRAIFLIEIRIKRVSIMNSSGKNLNLNYFTAEFAFFIKTGWKAICENYKSVPNILFYSNNTLGKYLNADYLILLLG